MDIDEIRRQNILILETESGSPASMAESLGMSYVQYVNLRDGAKDARSGKRRGMRKETAWRFEDAGKKERGWLDQYHSNISKFPEPAKTDAIEEIVNLMQKTDETGQWMIVAQSRLIVAERETKRLGNGVPQ